MSAYCHAGVTCKSINTEGYVVICINKHSEYKIDIGLDLPCGLMMSMDPDRPEFVIPFTGLAGQEVCAILGDDVNTERLSCPVMHAVPIRGEFRYEHILWPEVLDTYEKKRMVMNQAEKNGLYILHAPV